MTPKLPLPRGWKRPVRWSVLHILALSYHTPVAIANVLKFDEEHALSWASSFLGPVHHRAPLPPPMGSAGSVRSEPKSRRVGSPP